MEAFKNILAFSVAAAIFFTVAAGALFVIKGKDGELSELFGSNGDGEYVLLGKKVTLNKGIIRGIEGYLGHCRDFSELIFPDFFIAPIKTTATLSGAAVAGIVSDIYLLASGFVYGNM